MTDLRRTMLWVVFTMSLVMLWDAWNRHTGQPSLFMPTPARTIAPAASAPPSLPTQGSVSPLTGVPAAAAIATAPGASAAAASPPAGTAVPGASEVTVVTTDLVKASFDSVGGNLVRLELLKHADAEDRQRHVTLFD
ncbi:MAG: membrane protein insertase YidC, partial [Aquincola sp.]|nr:membrane protein insertase YidC [Aquincola sp.]